MLKKRSYPILSSGLKLNLRGLNRRFDPVALMHPNKQDAKGNWSSDCLLAVGATKELHIRQDADALEKLQSFLETEKGWKFIFLSYDLKNAIEDLSSGNKDHLDFPLLHVFVPRYMLQVEHDMIHVFYEDTPASQKELEEILAMLYEQEQEPARATPPVIRERTSKEQYIKAVEALQKHIRRGDIYEVNYCTEFYAENAVIDVVSVYEKLNGISRAPFSAFYRNRSWSLLSSSPERFLKKTGHHLLSQPIKGTIRRSQDPAQDERLKRTLGESPKERAENVMIVDLVRNDLSRIAKKGTVKVDELFGIHTFMQVHQMISTISCELKEKVLFRDILQACFPMGSMTGAPKLSAMKLIEEYEATKRGAYSGAIGFIDPEGNFDLSVIIRSILYNSSQKYVSFMAGSAITAKAEAAKEYEECLLKAKAMLEALSAS